LANGVFFGSTPATGVTPNPPNIVNAVSPPGAPGPVNITVTTPSNLQLIPESFSYGPWAVEAPASGATAEGGGISTVFGYGFGPTGPTSLPANLTAKLGGQTVPILNYAPIAIVPNTYPFPLQSFDFTVPAGTPGATADLTLTDDYGSATVSKSIQFLPALQRFPLPGSVLIQGIYDPRRDVYYFTDQNAVQVFSKTLGKWLSPINLPHAVAPAINRLWGISLSPDGSKLAISDAGTTLIYMVDPDTPGSVKTFVTPSAVASDTALPGGLAITDSGIIYYSTFYLNTTGNWAFHKLDTTTGTVSDYHTLQDGAVSDDAAIRVLLSNDNTRAFMNLEGVVVTLDTATDVMSFNFLIPQGDFELSLSSNQTWMTGTEYVMDTNLNAESRLVLNERETYNVTGVYGEKVSPDGNLLFSPLLNALDVFDGRTGVLRMRISLSIALSTNYDALVSDGKDNILVAITGQKGDGGVSVIDLSSLPEPPTSVFSSASNSNLVPITVPVPANGLKNSQPFFSVGDAAVPRPQKSTVNRVLQNVLVPHSHQ
jgi:hypothetical protein